MSNPELVRAKDLDQWAREDASHFEATILVRRLILATAAVAEIDFGAREDVFLSGWDGVLEARGGSPFVPDGASRWEVGVKKSGLRAKAQSDYDKRTADPLGADPATTTFVFATIQSANWRKQWRDDRSKDDAWADVRAYGASDLETWLETAPSVHYWISERLGRDPRDVTSPDAWWTRWSRRTQPALPQRFVLAGRDGVIKSVTGSRTGPGTVVTVVAPSREEALAVTCASLLSGGQAGSVLRARALIVSGAAAWARIIDSGHRLVLVPDFDDPDISTALAAGHHVILPAGRAVRPGRAVIRVPDLDRLTAARALADEQGMSWEEASSIAAHGRRNLLSLRRSIAPADSFRTPPWCEGEQGRRLAPLLLAGEWTDGSDGDRQVIEMVTGRAYADIASDLTAWSILEDPPVRRAGRTWRVISKLALWDLVSPCITAADLERFHRAVALVLEEPDPVLDAAPERRLMAALENPRTYSVRLRDSIADTVAFLAGYAGTLELDDGRTGARHASDLVDAVTKTMTADRSGRAWQSAADVLPLLAEASPDVFLSAAETSAKGDSPPLRAMFMDAEATANFGVSSPHIPLVEALQVLCWHEPYLGRAAAVLARLAGLDPGPWRQHGIRPAHALAGVLCLWAPQTPVLISGRLAVIDMLRSRFPAVAWPLLQDLIPDRYGLRPSACYPRWRDWHRGQGGQVPADQVDVASGQIASRMIEDAGCDAGRWAGLIGVFEKLLPGDRDRVLSVIERLDPDSLTDQGQITLWQALTEMSARHRQFPGTWWAMPPAMAGRVEQAAQRFEPCSPADLYSGLFSGAPRLPGTAPGDPAGYWQAVQSARHDAIRAVLDTDGVTGLLALGRKAELPAVAGWSAAEISGDLLTGSLLPLLGADGPDGQVARGYTGARIDAEGTGWAEQQLRQHPEWGTEQQARLLLTAQRPGMSLFALLQRFDPQVEEAFWQQMDPRPISDRQARRTAAAELTRHGRPWSAIPVLAALASSGQGLSEPGGIELAETVLLRAAAGPCTDSHSAGQRHAEVRDLLDYLERAGSDIATRARLELLFAVLLDQFRTARALADVLRAEPAVFAEIVSAAYLPDHQTREETEISPARANLSILGITALSSWRTPPGIRADGTVDASYLRTWVLEARQHLAQTGHTGTGDKKIGAILAHAPAGADGIWPPVPVRDLIEELESPDLEAGLIDGKIRADLMFRSPGCGGDAHRAAAAQFSRWAGQVTSQCRTSALLRLMAADADERARHEDRFSQDIEDLSP